MDILYFVYLLTGEHLRFFSSCRLLQKNCYECLYSGLCADIDLHFSWGETLRSEMAGPYGRCMSFSEATKLYSKFCFPISSKGVFQLFYIFANTGMVRLFKVSSFNRWVMVAHCGLNRHSFQYSLENKS